MVLLEKNHQIKKCFHHLINENKVLLNGIDEEM